MLKRTRLPKKSNLGKTDRLRSAIRTEVKMMSRDQLMEFSKATKSVIEIDPIMQTYKKLAVRELARRESLRKTWGKEEPKISIVPKVIAGKVYERLLRLKGVS